MNAVWTGLSSLDALLTLALVAAASFLGGLAVIAHCALDALDE